MKKSKFYVLSSLLIIILFFSVSALCNQCGVTSDTTDTTAAEGKTDVEDTNGSTTDKTNGTTDKTDEATDKTEDTDSTEDTSGNKAPTIELEIYEGPTYSAPDDICYYRVKAVVTGKPSPSVDFSKDDSLGTLGEMNAQVNLNRGDTYTLTATAENSEGEDTDTLTLSWGCGEENRDPVIAEIIISGTTIETNKTYDVAATASDPDGDTLTYEWTVSGGAINNTAANPMKWTTPGTAGNYTVNVTVTDGNGGEDTESATYAVTVPAPVNVSVSKVVSEGGYIANGGTPINPGGCLYAGDEGTNKWVVGFVSFDITGLTDATIQNANLTFNVKKKWSDPSFYSSICIYSTYYGAVPISVAAYSASGTPLFYIGTTGTGTFGSAASAIKTNLQAAINAGRSRFQIGVSPQGTTTDSDNTWDGFEWDQSGITLNITYIPGS